MAAARLTTAGDAHGARAYTAAPVAEETPMLRPFAVVLVAAASSFAQEPAELRAHALGEVRDAGGAPWVGAEVVLLSRPIPDDPDCGEADRVVVVTGERGRFRAPVLRGRPYSAWAWGAATAAGRPATAVAENVFAQQPVVLQQCRLLAPRRVTIEHADRWPGRTLHLRVVDELGNRDVHLVGCAHGRAELPPLVAANASIEVLARREGRDVPLCRVELPAERRELTVALPERRSVRCWAVSAADAPIASATVMVRLCTRLHVAGTTGAGGALALDLPERGANDPALAVFVDADGFAPGICVTHDPKHRFEPPPGCEPGDLFCRVDARPREVVRVVGGDGAPLVGARWLEQASAMNRPMRGGGSHGTWKRESAADRTGTAAFARHGRLGLLLRDQDLAALPAPWRAGMHPTVTAPLAAATGDGTADKPVLVDLRQLCPIELTFTDAGGTPMRGVRVAVCTVQDERRHGGWTAHGRPLTDERGHVRMLVPAAHRLGLAAVSGMRLFVRTIETGPSRADAGPATATFVMPPELGITGRVLDAAGEPLPGRFVHASFGTDNVPAAWSYEEQPAAVLADTGRNTMRVVLPTDRMELLLLTSLIGGEVTTDAEGRFRLPLPDARLAGLLLFQRRADATSMFGGKHVPWHGQSIDDVELRLEPWDR
jgi:hypothetical protein